MELGGPTDGSVPIFQTAWCRIPSDCC